ncbi:hypothetical protein [Jannaschia marina]|uniref:hypothetical protein n=1 Tax=Jannaschia marina TaxID=2741674 RepID=UPI0015C92A90|nr:hypothetical protein [Jannaschia marina]
MRCKEAASGLSHLKNELSILQDGLQVNRIEIEHDADEIAAALYDEMSWMSVATEVVWHGLRDSARRGLAGLRFPPMILVGRLG